MRWTKGSTRPIVPSPTACWLPRSIQRGTATAAAIFNAKGADPNRAQYRTLALADLEKGVALEAKEPRALLLIAKLNLLPQGDAKRAVSALDEAVKVSAAEPLVQAEVLVLRAAIRTDVKDKLADLDEAVHVAPTQTAALLAARAAAATKASSKPPWKTSTASSSWTPKARPAISARPRCWRN